MKVVILAGGFGTRLLEETTARPKPMVEIGGRPILWHIMKHYSVFGHHDFIICLGYKGDIIRDYFYNYRIMNTDAVVDLGSGSVTTLDARHDEASWKVLLAETGLGTGTGGRIKGVEKYIEDDIFLATYGDSLSDVPIDKVIEHHKKMGRVATMCVMHTSQRFGVVATDDGMVTKFEEKPEINAEWINGGFYVFSRKVFDYLSSDEDCLLEQEPLRQLVADGQLSAYEHEGCHRAMDSLRDMRALNEEWDSGQAPWKTW